MLLAGFATYSCSDDDKGGDSSYDRLMRPAFRTRYTVSAGTSDPYLCEVRSINQIFLAWNKIEGAAGYEIKMSTYSRVNSGEEAWENPDNILLDTILPANRDTLILRNLSYSTHYRFAIRALSERGAAHNSQWWGYGDGQHWSDYLGLQTEARYSTPKVFPQTETTTTKSEASLVINRLVDEKHADYKEWIEHFSTTEDQYGNKVWQMHYLKVSATDDNPGSKVPAEFQHKVLTDDMFDEEGFAYIDVAELDSNSVYIAELIDETIPIAVDAVVGATKFKTKGDPGEPIVIEAAPQDTMMVDGQVINLEIPATMLSDVLADFMKDITLSEGQTFYLRGGEEYFFRGNLDVYKGFKLATLPEDLEAGKGRAKVYMGGVAMNGTATRFMCFMLGRMPNDGENADLPIFIESLIFEDLDIDCPLAQNAFENSASGNYFSNQYNGGMGISIKEYIVRNCSFQHLIRGFFRTQCQFGEFIDNFIVEDCEFYNCGGYSGNGSGYGFITGDQNNPNSNIFRNMVWRNNTFFDTPIGNFITHGTGTGKWTDPTLVFNITIENNTFINWNTYSGRPMLSLRSIPAGSTFNIYNNLFVQTKADGDERDLYLQGADIRTLDGACEGLTVFNIYNNWSTNDNVDASTGEVFTSNSFSATKNSFGAWFNQPEMVTYPQGLDELKVHVAGIKATELMHQPNPPHKQIGEAGVNDHYTDDLEGKGSASANLYFKHFDNDIVRNNVGAIKWRESR